MMIKLVYALHQVAPDRLEAALTEGKTDKKHLVIEVCSISPVRFLRNGETGTFSISVPVMHPSLICRALGAISGYGPNQVEVNYQECESAETSAKTFAFA